MSHIVDGMYMGLDMVGDVFIERLIHTHFFPLYRQTESMNIIITSMHIQVMTIIIIYKSLPCESSVS